MLVSEDSGPSEARELCSFSIEEELLCVARSWNGGFVLCSEYIFTFQLATYIYFLKEDYYV